MKVKVNEPKNEKPFPKLMKSEHGSIVLFTDNDHGVCLVPKLPDEKLGEYFEDWIMGKFTDFEGTITLSNE